MLLFLLSNLFSYPVRNASAITSFKLNEAKNLAKFIWELLIVFLAWNNNEINSSKITKSKFLILYFQRESNWQIKESPIEYSSLLYILILYFCLKSSATEILFVIIRIRISFCNPSWIIRFITVDLPVPIGLFIVYMPSLPSINSTILDSISGVILKNFESTVITLFLTLNSFNSLS